MSHRIESSGDEVPCASCSKPIGEGEDRFAEAIVPDDGKTARSLRYARTRREFDMEYDRWVEDHGSGPKVELGRRFYHLECAARDVPGRIGPVIQHSSLSPGHREALVALIEAEHARKQRVFDPAAEDEATRDEYARFIGDLADATDDEGNVVFGDWLQTVGDPRGDLIALQIELETATGWTRDRLIETERKMWATQHHLHPDTKQPSVFTWRRGFVFAIHAPAADLESWLEHPSVQLVRELYVYTFPRRVPRTLRSLDVIATRWSEGDLSAIAKLPQLRRLQLPLDTPLHELRHDTLLELHLSAGSRSPVTHLGMLDRKQLPALRTLTLSVPGDRLAPTLEQLAASKLKPLEHLVLRGSIELDELGPVEKLELATLDLRETSLPYDAAAGKLATMVLLPAPPVEIPAMKAVKGPWRVRHTKRPEWGIGEVIDETEQGLQVEFADAGEKLIRNVELLEDVE